jgi:uncharacterized protein
MALDPVILFFLLGLGAGLARSELRLPSSIYDFLSIVLLLAIGLKGGVELARQPFLSLLPQLLGVTLLGLLLPLLAYPVLLRLGRLKRADAASIAAHYGSVSVGTYAVAEAWLVHRAIPFEAHAPVFVVVLEMPAIVIGILLARGLGRATRWRPLAHEVLLGKGMVLLAGGLLIGWLAGPAGVAPLEPLFFDLFKGILALFLLEMGLITAAQAGGLRRHGPFLIAFGIGAPLVFGLLGALCGLWIGLSPGGVGLLATLAASASYIAVPAAMRMAVPEANPSLSLSTALGVTFPFNVVIGIPLYMQLAHTLTAG